MRLQIHPALLRAWRAPGRLQIGLDPRHGVILDGLTQRDELVLDALAGGIDTSRLRALALRTGLPQARVHDLVEALRRAGVLVGRHTPPSRLRSLPPQVAELLRPHALSLALTYPGGDGWDLVVARRTRTVAVAGGGATGIAVAVGLARAGVGQVCVLDDTRVADVDVHPGGYRPADVGRRREEAAREVLTRAVPSVRTVAPTSTAPDLVVAVRWGGVDASRYDGLLREEVPHLLVLLREHDAVVGPLVRPGRTSCLRCLDLHRRDRDPEWPRVVLQLAARASSAEDPVLSALAAAVAVAQALTQLDGRVDPASLGATLEITLPDGTTAARDWPGHPACGCRSDPFATSTPVDRLAPRAAVGRTRES